MLAKYFAVQCNSKPHPLYFVKPLRSKERVFCEAAGATCNFTMIATKSHAKWPTSMLLEQPTVFWNIDVPDTLYYSISLTVEADSLFSRCSDFSGKITKNEIADHSQDRNYITELVHRAYCACANLSRKMTRPTSPEKHDWQQLSIMEFIVDN